MLDYPRRTGALERTMLCGRRRTGLQRWRGTERERVRVCEKMVAGTAQLATSPKSQSRIPGSATCQERVRVWRSMGPKEDREILCCRHFSLSNCIEIAQNWVEDRDCRRVKTIFSGPRWVLGIGTPGWENCDNPHEKQAGANRVASSSTAWQQGPWERAQLEPRVCWTDVEPVRLVPGSFCWLWFIRSTGVKPGKPLQHSI
ncbi:hypothetical protein BDP81DRAFT_90883 [Colletotrichum phormii]|uniref:Uncharacterized protein n=1 Tax=Colletotrichum phormii TaxID=359342 RepID=A0AAJ0A1T8_9PEZI|nr:uncharacterized protein BDP81DRAFT_90883 [Colletotrichum phormii]KAK1654912.1 hypothetical protein BDP81DRAFT_90883 [Colletotrichum phormii]